MGIIGSDKILSKKSIDCYGEFDITLSLTAGDDTMSCPNDIILILDKSGSMADSAIDTLKNSVKAFIDTVNSTSCNTGEKTEMAVITFSNSAVTDAGLTFDTDTLTKTLDSMNTAGLSNHYEAFLKAKEIIQSSEKESKKIILMLTDGISTAGADAALVAEELKEMGVVIYTIGLSNTAEGIDKEELKRWASYPDQSYVYITPSEKELGDIFTEITKSFSNNGATNIRITETVSPCFKIKSISTPSKGTASITDSTSLFWRINNLGLPNTETATLTFTVDHIGPCTGEIEVNDSIVYSDNEGHNVTFPSPKITVNCSGEYIAEPCPPSFDIEIGECEDYYEFDAQNVSISSVGRILNLSLTLKSVCPNKRVALAVILTETDDGGIEYNRGMKTFTIVAHDKNSCKDIPVSGIKFVLPENPEDGTDGQGLCRKRKLKVRFISNYIDTDYACYDLTL